MDPMPFNRTKIVATLGPASSSKDVLTQLFKAGIDVARINASHGSHEVHRRTIELVREINAELDSHVSILFDLQGPKIRIGTLPQPVPIQPGQRIELSTAIKELDGNRIPMVYETFAQDVKAGDTVLVEDGKVQLRVLETDRVANVLLEVINGTNIGSRKGVNLPGVAVSLPSLTDKDKEDVAFGLEMNVDWFALSFVRRAEDLGALKRLLEQHNCKAKVIAKIEKPEALKVIDDIIMASDGIMVARGDLGVEIPIEEVPFWQKRIVRRCNELGRPVIVATQMLESMIENPRPTRAEATDVANAVLDGSDAVMVSGETSVGAYPVEVVNTMQRIIAQAEQEATIYHKNWPLQPKSRTFQSDAICLAAVKLAEDVNAKALVAMTRSGYSAFQIARHRPSAPIYIFTDNRQLLYILNLVWGVQAFYYDQFVGTNESITDVLSILKDRGYLNTGDVVVNAASMPLGRSGRTNTVKFTVAE